MAGLNSIEGLASNLNTTDIVNATLEYARQPAVLLETRQAEITKEITTFNALSAKLLALQASIKSLNSKTKLSQASIDISDDNYLAATATDIVGNGTYSLNILSLARNHQIASQGVNESSQAIFGTGTITIAAGDQSSTTVTISEGENSLVGIKDAINKAGAGVTASIINDGTTSKPYRLVLTGNKTGQKNKISISSSLTGGENLDFESSAFDDPERINFSTQATSAISLGATAGYTGATNKTYIFTIGGNGTQTVGNGNIIIDWVDASDPSNSGTIVVDQADKIIEGGPEGLTLSFGDGDLVAGDSFQVSAFAPLLQQAADARVSIGSFEDGASPIVVNSSTNTFDDLITGLSIEVKNVTTAASGPVTIKTGLNVEGIKSTINDFIQAYNSAMEFIDEQNKYDSETNVAGTLLGDLTLMTIQSRLQGMITNTVKGLDSSINSLASIGIRTGATGRLSIVDSFKLTEALENDFQSVLDLFIDGGKSTNGAISFLTASSEIAPGSSFDIDITQAATQGYLEGISLYDFSDGGLELNSTNNKIKLRVDGLVSDEIVLNARTYTSGADLARELQTRINADSKIGNRGVTVAWQEENGARGHLEIKSSSFGSSSRVDLITSITNNAYSELGLSTGTTHVGEDVAGTINGEKATGKGQVLTGDADNSTTAGLSLKITLTGSEIIDGTDGKFTFTKGISSIIYDGLDSITKSVDGVIARKTSGLQKEVDNLKRQIDDFDERLMLRRERLLKQWADLETILGQLQTESSFLESQLQQISANTSYMLGNRTS